MRCLIGKVVWQVPRIIRDGDVSDALRKSPVKIDIVPFTTTKLAGRGTFELHSPTRRNGHDDESLLS